MATASVERMKRLQAGKSRTKMARSEWKLLLQSVVNHRTRFLPAWKTKPRWSKPVLRGRSRPEANGGAVRVGKTWRSRKGGAWLVEPCMLGTDTCGSGAAKVRLRWRSRAGWKDVAEPERWCLDGGAVSVGNRRWSRKAVGWMWKAKPKSTKENTRTTKGSEDGRHKRLRKQNISCQKENKSLETIVFFSGNKRFAEQTLAEAEPQKLGLDGGAVRVGKTWRSRKGGAWMAEPCLLGTEGGAGTQLDEVWKAKPKSTKRKYTDDKRKRRR